MSELDEPTPDEVRDELLAPGAEFLTRVAALLRVGRTYTTRNQLFIQQLEMLAETSGPYLRERGEMLFVSYGSELFLDGLRIGVTSQGYRLARGLVAELERRGICGFEVSGEPRVEDWRTFFELILDPAIPPGAALLAEARARGLACVVPVLGVLEEAPSDDSDGGSGGADRATTQAERNPEEASARIEDSMGALGGQLSPTARSVLGAAPKRYAAALDGLRSLVMNTRWQRTIEVRHARRVVQPVVDSAVSHEPVVLGLAGMIKRDEFTYARNVNACIIATVMGQGFGFDRATLANLSVAALLHGIGRASTTEPERIGPAGAVLLARRLGMQESTVHLLRVALEAGAGSAPPGKSSALSQIVGVAAMYSRLASSRDEVGKSTTPAQALGMIIGPLTGGIDPALKVALVDAIGYHPPGQLVSLDDGMLGLVVACNRDELARPVVQPFRGPKGRALQPGVDWEGGILPVERSISRDLLPTDLPEDLAAAA